MLTNMQSPLVKPQGSSPELSKQEIKSKLKVSPNVQNTVKNVVCPAHHFAVTPVEYMHTFKSSVAITPNYVVCMHTLLDNKGQPYLHTQTDLNDI